MVTIVNVFLATPTWAAVAIGDAGIEDKEPIATLSKSVRLSTDAEAVTPPVPVANDQSAVVMRVDRAAYTDAGATLLMTIEAFTEEKGWVFVCSAVAPGGELKDKNKNVIPFSTISCPLPPGKGRGARISIKVLKGAANVSGDLLTK